MTDFGQRLRAKRRLRNMTLKQLSEKTKLSVSMLSEIERGVAQPSMSSLKRISQVMGFSFFDFEDEDAYTPKAVAQPAERQAYITDIKVVKANERKKLMDPKRSPYLYELLTPDFKRMFEVLYLSWEPGFSSGPDAIQDPPGEKFVFVLKGSVEYRIGDTVVQLDEGDSVYYPSGMQVFFRVLGDEPCHAIGVGTPPSF
jgi:transcriptional regulator with XRE-family HTH domain